MWCSQNGRAMLKKLGVSAAVLALPLAFVGVIGVTPAVGVVPVITANGTVTCTKLVGKITFVPALHTTGTANKEVSTIKVTLAGCTTTSTNLPAGSIIKGTATSKITTITTDKSANACAGLGTSRATVQTVVWTDKKSTGVTLATLTKTVAHYSGFDVLSNSLSEPGFDLPQDSGGTASATGSFVGSDAGASSQANIFGKKTATQLGTSCNAGTGLASLLLGAAGTTADPSQSISG